MAQRNPFEFGRELGADELVDREDELRELGTVIAEQRKHFLVGPRRFGKSCLLAASAESAERSGALVLRYNVELFPSLDLLAQRLVRDATARLTGTSEKVVGAAKVFFKQLKPEFRYDPSDGTWSVTFGSGRDAAPLPLLVDALEGVERLAQGRDQPTAVVLDEFQSVVEPGGVAAEGQVRAVIQQHRHVAYVFSGSNTRLLTAMVGDPNRPLYRLGSWRFLGAIPRPPLSAFLANGLGTVAAVTDEGITAILDSAEDVPYNVQLLAHGCWEEAHETGRKPELTREFVETMQAKLAMRHDPVYSQLWSGLTPAQQKTILAVIHERGEALASTAVARRYNLPITTLQRGVESLTAKRLLWPEASGGSTRLRLEDPLFGAWIRLKIPTPT